MRTGDRLVGDRLGLRLLGGLLDARRLHVAEDRTRFLLRIDPKFPAAVDVQPIEVAVIFDVLGARFLVDGHHETALDERALDVVLGLVPFLRQIIGAHAHARTALIAAEVGFDGVEKYRQLLLLGGAKLVPIVLGLVVGLGIVVARGVHRLAETVVRGGFLLDKTGRRRLGGGGGGPRGSLEFRGKLRAELLRLGLRGGGGGIRERPVALRRTTREAGEREQIVGRGVILDDFPLVAAEIVQKFFQHRGRGKATFPAGDDLIFPE